MVNGEMKELKLSDYKGEDIILDSKERNRFRARFSCRKVPGVLLLPARLHLRLPHRDPGL